MDPENLENLVSKRSIDLICSGDIGVHRQPLEDPGKN
jgi:hypothetical protein